MMRKKKESQHLLALRNINGYLPPAPDAFIERRKAPLCDVPPMVRGCQPTDNGNFLLNQSEHDDLISKEPKAERWIRPFSMGAEYINGTPRYCLWLVDAEPCDLDFDGDEEKIFVHLFKLYAEKTS